MKIFKLPHKLIYMLPIKIMLISLAFVWMMGNGLMARAADAAGNKIIVIDPGHGGSNMGAQIPGLDEKNANMATALAMKDELEKYQGVKVHLTRIADVDMSLEERVQAASELGADYLFSLHYNMSNPHRLYGAEVWIQSTGEYYSKGYSVADAILNELCDDYGLLRRGIKTKLNDRGNEYYGILRHGTAYGVTSMIVEHCHLDNPRDYGYFVGADKLSEFGRRDAKAVARALGLSSSALGIVNPAGAVTAIPAPTSKVAQDKTPPEEVQILSAKKNGNYTTATIRAFDSQSPVIYYDYSFDGVRWSDLMPFKPVGKEMNVLIPKTGPTLTVRCYNHYDGFTQSAAVGVD